MNHKIIKWLIPAAFLFVFLGLLISISVLSDYWSKVGLIHFDNDSSFADLGTVLSGTSGVLFTIASVVFFTYSLYQTNLEMKETQSIMKRQLSESTFFNLLKHHRELVTSFSSDLSFNDRMTHVISQLEFFADHLNRRTFDSFEQTFNSPLPLYNNTKTVKIVGSSLIHIANLIHERLDGDLFYHTTFYTGLSDNERFLLGMIIQNQLEGPTIKYSFNYCGYYDKKSPFINADKSRYFPPLKISTSLKGHVRLQGFNAGFVKMIEKDIKKVTEIAFESPDCPKLKSIECFIEDKPGNFYMTFKEGESYSIYDFFETRLIEELSNEQPVTMTAVFTFMYRNEDFYVKGFRMRLWAKGSGSIFDIGINRLA